jgi:hypothetical protein
MLLLQNVGFVPLADIDMDIPTNVEIVRLNIRIVMVASIQSAKDLIEELDDGLV